MAQEKDRDKNRDQGTDVLQQGKDAAQMTGGQGLVGGQGTSSFGTDKRGDGAGAKQSAGRADESSPEQDRGQTQQRTGFYGRAQERIQNRQRSSGQGQQNQGQWQQGQQNEGRQHEGQWQQGQQNQGQWQQGQQNQGQWQQGRQHDGQWQQGRGLLGNEQGRGGSQRQQGGEQQGWGGQSFGGVEDRGSSGWNPQGGDLGRGGYGQRS